MDQTLGGKVSRHLQPVVEARLADEIVLLIEGPRSVGKSTLLRDLASAHGVGVVDLDDSATRDALNADPAGFVSGGFPICIDEYQKAPLVLDAIKARLNREGSRGRFILTGSTRYDALPTAAQALTGRLHRMSIYPLAQAEIAGVGAHLLADLFADAESAVSAAPSTTTRDDYINRIVRGGFPMVLARASAPSRNRWFDDYVRLTIERDVRELSNIRQAAALPRLLERLAGQTAQVLNVARAAASIGLDERTAMGYVRLLEAVFLVQRLPAWGSTLTARATAHPKIHVLDSGVASRLLRLTPDKLARRQAVALTEFGHLLETFVVGELFRQASLLDGIAGLGHWRTYDQDEVDLVVESDDGSIVAFEVKVGSRVPGENFRPLQKLRDAVGESFVAGVVLYLGEHSYSYEDRLHVMPVDRLWRP